VRYFAVFLIHSFRNKHWRVVKFQRLKCSYTGLAFCLDTILLSPQCQSGPRHPRSRFFASKQNASTV
jgi:hypothetical protein